MLAPSRLPFPVGRLALAGALLTTAVLADDGRVLEGAFHHLGNDPTPDWTEAPVDPEGKRFDMSFDARANDAERVLSWRQRSVDSAWRIEINGVELCVLPRGDGQPAQRFAALPPGVLRDGSNDLAVVPTDPNDDITIGDIRLYDATFREYFNLAPLTVRVTDAASGAALPARVTIVDASGHRPALFFGDGSHLALRDGVAYTSSGSVALELAQGEYDIYATRGSEWSLDHTAVRVDIDGATARATLALTREVDTRGFVAADTHIHTLTFSGHGDASIDERMVTLAGEGVELAVATDHNHNIDYRPYQENLGLESYFTPVMGNEVTTKVGHFNAFPMDHSDDIPGFRSTDFVTLVEGMRSKGAQVVILNHPRWPAHDTGPWGVFGLDTWTGDVNLPRPLPFDATELINATTEEASAMTLFEDWFALLNAGERVVAVGSSDSHTVGDPVGGGRTYVPSTTDDPSKIDVDAACTHLAGGRTSISMGIFTDVLVEGASMGATAALDGTLDVRLRVAAPGWVRPRLARVFANGVEIARRELAVERDAPLDVTLDMSLPWPHRHDAWIVCVVTGDAVDGHYWPLLNPYTLGATNPVWLDVDGDGVHQSPREVADALANEVDVTDGAQTRAALARCDAGVGVQLLHALLATQPEARRPDLAAALAEGLEGREFVSRYLATFAAEE